jgi:type IV pilus assembly protein PilX
MSVSASRRIARQSGMVLVTALLMLVVVTIIALAMFRSFGVDQKIAGNLREKQRALNAAETAEQYAEYWLANGGTANTAPATCSTPSTAVSPTTPGQICLNGLDASATLPWTATGNNVGVTYTPNAPTYLSPTASLLMPIGVPAAATGNYYAAPQFYITYVGVTTTQGTIYQIDAVGYGGSPDTAAVVESTYKVQTSVQCLSCNP